MNFEERMRELAKGATPGPWVVDRALLASKASNRAYKGTLAIYHRQQEDHFVEVIESDNEVEVIRNPRDADHIAFNDPKTALLVAEVIAAGRDLRHELEEFDAEARVRIKAFDEALAALDMHPAAGGLAAT